MFEVTCVLLPLVIIQILYRFWYSKSWKPAWTTGKMMVSWCRSQKLMRRRDAEITCGVLYQCGGTWFITLEMFSSSGYQKSIVLPHLPSRFPTSLLLQRRNDSAVVFSLSAADDLGASFSSGYHLFYSLLLSKAVGWEWRKSPGFTNAELDC